MFEFAIDMEHGGDCQHINVHRCEWGGNRRCVLMEWVVLICRERGRMSLMSCRSVWFIVYNVSLAQFKDDFTVYQIHLNTKKGHKQRWKLYLIWNEYFKWDSDIRYGGGIYSCNPCQKCGLIRILYFLSDSDIRYGGEIDRGTNYYGLPVDLRMSSKIRLD